MGSENGNYVPDGAWRMQMESKGETVDDVVTAATTFECEGRIRAERVKFIAADIARRCKEAHEREVADLRRCLKEAVDDYFKNQCPRCAGCRSTLRCEYKGWKAVLEKYTKAEGDNGK